MLNSAGDLSAFAGAVGDLASAVIGVAVVFATAYFRRYHNVKIEEKHMIALQTAAETWAEEAVTRGLHTASVNLGRDFLSYARASVPDAVSALVKDEWVVDKIANKYLKRAWNAAAPGDRFDFPAKEPSGG